MNGANINYISLHEAAKLTNYSQDYISLLCRQKKIKGTKIGRNWVTTKEWVENYVNKTKGSGENIIPVKIKNVAAKELGSEASQLSSLADLAETGLQADSTQSMESTDLERVANPLLRENNNAQESILIFFRKMILTTFVVGIFGIGFVFFSNRVSFSVNQMFSESKKITAYASFNVNSFLSSFDKDQAKKEFGIVAGVKTSVDEENDSEAENEKVNDGIVIIPLEGEIDSEENQKFIEKLSSSFSDDIDITPSGDGVSGVITSREDPNDNYLYLMVPVEN